MKSSGEKKGAERKGSSDDSAVVGSDEAVLESQTNSPRNVKALLEKLSEFLTENNLEHQIQEERNHIQRKIESKNEEISQKRETHRHALNEVHEAYKREIQRENERHVDDLKVTEHDISILRLQLDELEQLNVTVSSKIPCSKSNSAISERESGRVRELLECPVCLEEMRPPKKIFQCSNGHVICEHCKNNPEVRSCPTCRVKFRGNNVVRNIVAEKLARNTYDSSDSEENSPRSAHTRESNPVELSGSPSDDFPILGFQPAYGYIGEEEGEPRDDDDDDFVAWARIIGQEESGVGSQHRRLTDPQPANPTGLAVAALPRLRDAHLIRTYRPNSRYIPHHVRRQRTPREEEQDEQVDTSERSERAGDRGALDQDRIFLRGPRIPRRSEFRILR